MPQGRKGYIGLGKEATFGVPVAAARYHRFRSESVVTAIEEVTPPNILGVFDEGPTYQGLKTHSGPIEFDGHPVNLGDYLLGGAGPVVTTPMADSTAIQINVVAAARTFTRLTGSFIADGFLVGDTVVMSGFTNSGNNGTKTIEVVTALVITITSATGLANETGDGNERVVAQRWQHDFAPRQTEFSADCIPQPFTFEIFRDVGDAFQFAGGGINTLQFQFGVGNKVLGVQAGLIAKTMARITATSPTYEVPRAFQWREAVITLPDPTVMGDIQDLTLNIENGYEGKAYIDGTQEFKRIRAAGSRVVTASGVMLAKDAEIMAFLAGTEQYLKIVFTGPALGGGTHKLEYWFPKFRYTAYPVGIGGPDEIMVSFAGKAKYDPNTSNTPFKIRLVNGQASY